MTSSNNKNSTRYPLIWWWFAAPCEGGACVQVASAGDGVAMRDSKDTDGPVLLFTGDEWTAFLAGAKAGEFDHLP